MNTLCVLLTFLYTPLTIFVFLWHENVIKFGSRLSQVLCW